MLIATNNITLDNFKVYLNDFIKNNVCISGVNGDFGPLASYNPSALRGL
jgi:hypothetical protein